MIITRMHLSRRTVLKGMGAALALPFLDAMVPALSAIGKTEAKAANRFARSKVIPVRLLPLPSALTEDSLFQAARMRLRRYGRPIARSLCARW